MRTINKKSAAIFQRIIKEGKGETAFKIKNSNSFMPLVVEKIGENIDIVGRAVDVYSFAHYYEQNGDLVPDPEMTFAVSRKDPLSIWPMSFYNAYYYEEGIFCKNGHWLISTKKQKDEAVFAGQWLENIKYQQNI